MSDVQWQELMSGMYQAQANQAQHVEPFVLVDVYFNSVTETKCKTEAEAIELVETAARFPGWRYSRILWRGETRRVFKAEVLG